MSSPIPARTPFLDARGFVSWPWLKWLQELAGPGSPGGGGGGGGGGPINSSVDDAVLLAATHHQESSSKPNTEFGAADALDVLRTGPRPSDDTAFFITQGRILREMIDQDARMMLAMLTPSQRPQTVGNLIIPVLTATAPVAPDTDFNVSHALGRIPAGYLIVGRDMATDIYNGTTAWTDTDIYLRSSIGSAAISLFVF